MNIPAAGVGAALLFGSAIASAGAVAIQWTPAPPDMIEGARFVAPAWNVSLEAPAADWSWFYVTQPVGPERFSYRAAACRSPDPAVQFLVSAFERHHGALDAQQAEEMARGAASAFEKQGWTVKVASTAESTIPLPGSYRYVLDASQGEALVHVYGYMAAKGRIFALQHVSREVEEPPAFRRFVESFRFVGEPVPDPVEQLGTMTLVLAMAVTLLLGGCGWIVNRLAGRVVVNLWSVALVVLVAGGIALHVALWSKARARGATPFDQGYLWGRAVMGPLVWPAAVAIWRARAVRRQRAAERVDTSRVDDVFG